VLFDSSFIPFTGVVGADVVMQNFISFSFFEVENEKFSGEKGENGNCKMEMGMTKGWSLKSRSAARRFVISLQSKTFRDPDQVLT
jgi:hypothetical protein